MAANRDMPKVLRNTQRIFKLARKYNTDFIITYEADKNGPRRLADRLRGQLPDQQKELIKTTFGAVGLPAFKQAIRNTGATHVLLLGAETDVCVLQTALGLHQMGVHVLLQSDAVFSSEPNISSALSRYRAAGVQLVTMTETENLLAGRSRLRPNANFIDSSIVPARRNRINTAVLLTGLNDGSLQSSRAPYKKQKLQRIRQLLVLSQWLQMPVYADRLVEGKYALPKTLLRGTSRQMRKVLQTVRVLPANRLRRSHARQIFLAGVAKPGKSTPTEHLPRKFVKKKYTVVADSLLGYKSEHDTSSRYTLAYKSIYYGMRRSIDHNE